VPRSADAGGVRRAPAIILAVVAADSLCAAKENRRYARSGRELTERG
jgi:hypothetical protein